MALRKKYKKPRKQRALIVRSIRNRKRILIQCNASGEIVIKSSKYSRRVLKWLRKYMNKPAPVTYATIDISLKKDKSIEYLKEIFRTLCPLFDTISIKWYCMNKEEIQELIDYIKEEHSNLDINII